MRFLDFARNDILCHLDQAKRVERSKIMTKMKKYIILFAALMGAMLWTGCQKEEEQEIVKDDPVEETTQLFTLTVQAVKNVETKALELVNRNGHDLINAYWVDGEQVAVYNSSTKAFLGMLTVDADNNNRTKATLSGTLSSVEGVTYGTNLYLLFPRTDWDYTGQDGSAPSADGSLARKYDYAAANVSVSSIGNGIITTSSAFFSNQQEIYRFGFKEGGSGGTAVSVKEFTVASDASSSIVRNYDYSSNKYTFGSLTVKVPGTATTDLLYMAIHNSHPANQTYSFHIISGDNALYTGSQSIPDAAFQNSDFISAKNVNVSQATLTTASATTSDVW